MNLNSTHQWTQVADVYSLLVWSSQTKQVILRRMAKQLGPVNMTKLTLVSLDRITFWYSHVKFYHYFVNPKWFSFLKMNKTAKQPSNDYLTWPDCLKLILNVIFFFLVPKWYKTSKSNYPIQLLISTFFLTLSVFNKFWHVVLVLGGFWTLVSVGLQAYNLFCAL